MNRMRKALVCFVLSFFTVTCTGNAAGGDIPLGSCAQRQYLKNDLIVCHFAGDMDIRLFLNDDEGNPFRHFNFVNDWLGHGDETLRFAMNAGMYHKDRSPVGLYVERAEMLTSLNTRDGPGNFHLKPNGVFWISGEGEKRTAGVSAAEVYSDARGDIIFATQSGPMLVIDGKLHPRFIEGSESLKRRNGVGVDRDGDVWFVLSDTPLNFFSFATYFRDVLETPHALYLDGTISRIFAPSLGRNDPGVPMGPIVGVVAPVTD